MGYFGPGSGTTDYGQVYSSAHLVFVFVFILICRCTKKSQGQNKKGVVKIIKIYLMQIHFLVLVTGRCGKC